MAEAGIELATVYVSLVPSLRGAPEAIGDAVSKAAKSSRTRKATASLGDQVVDGITKAIGSTRQIPAAVSKAAKSAVSGLSSLKTAAGNAAKATQAVATAFSETKEIAAGAAKYVGLSWDGVMEAIAPKTSARMRAVRKIFTDGMSGVSEIVKQSGAYVAGRWAEMTKPVRQFWTRNVADPVRSTMAEVRREVTWVTGGIAQGVKDLGVKAVAPLTKHLGGVGLAASAAGVAVKSQFGKATEWVGKQFQTRLSEPFSKAMGVIGSNVRATGSVVANAAGAMGRAWSPVFSKVASGASSAFSKIGGVASSAMSSVGSAVGRGMSGVVNIAASSASAVGNAISGGVSFGVHAATAALAGLGAVISKNMGGAIARADLINNFPKVMANIGYSADDARKQVDRISEALDGLPTSTDALVSTAKGLAPLTGDLSKATDVALALNNALLAGGASSTLAENAMEQYRQMLSNGTVDMMGWRSMTMAMPGQMDALAKSLLGATANTSDLYDAMKSGDVSFEDFNAKLLELNESGADGMASFAEQAKTASGGIGTAFTNVGNRIKKAISSVLEAIGVDAIAKKINDATSGIVDLGKRIGEAITKMKEGGVDKIGADLSGLLPVLGLVAGGLSTVIAGMLPFGSSLLGLTGPVGLLLGSLAAMWAKSELLRKAVGDLGGALVDALGSPSVKNALEILTITIGNTAKALGDSLGLALELVAPSLAYMAERLVPVLSQTFGALLNSLTPLVGSVLVRLGEIVAALLGPLTDLTAAVLPVITSAIDAIVGALSPLVDSLLGAIRDAINTIMPPLTNMVRSIMPLIRDAIEQVAPLLAEIGAKIGELIGKISGIVSNLVAGFIPVIQNIITTVLPFVVPLVKGIISAISSAIDVLSAILVPVIQFVADIVLVAVKAMAAVFTWLWSNIIGPVVDWITEKLRGLSDWMSGTLVPLIGAAIQTVKDVFQSVKDKAGEIADGVKSAFESMKSAVETVWDGIRGAAAKPVNFLIQTVYTDGIKKLVEGMASKVGLSLTLPEMSTIPEYASGGVLPGYTPGRDVYHFVSHDGGGALALSGGEAIMRPEWTRAVGGPRAVAAMNAAARYGRPIPGGDVGRSAAFADGGIWERVKGTVGGAVSAAGEWLSDAADAVASIIQDPIGAVTNLIRVPVDALVSRLPGAGAFADVAKAVPGQLIDGFGNWLKGETASMAASDIVAAARKAIGVPYVWGGSSIPPGVDCSGLVYWAAHQMGSWIPRLTAAGYQSMAGGPANRNVAGNLLFWGNPAYHVAITAGGGSLIEAPKPGAVVREAPIWGGPTARSFKFDDGGWLQPGHTSVVNETGKPEAVFTSGQWSKMDELIEALRENTARDLTVRDVDDRLVGRMRVEADSRVVEAIRINRGGF